MLKLNGEQYQALETALLSAFPDYDDLQRMIKHRLDMNLQEIVMGPNLRIIVFKLIQTAEAGGWTDQLIGRAREAKPGNPLMVAFCQEVGLSPKTPTDAVLEKIIRDQNFLLNPAAFRQELGKLENKVCRVEIVLSNGGKTYGTGFLVGPDLLLSNYHVMEPVIESKDLAQAGRPWASPSNVSFRFDYKVLDSRFIVNPGTVHRLTEKDWLVDCSPMSQWDEVRPPKGGSPRKDELDYALLRLKGSPGKEAVGIKPEPGAQLRGWVKIAEGVPELQPDSAILILQHPKAEPLKLALDTSASIAFNENGTRITYRTNTEPGSSGAPCFNMNWELVALHHAGDPDSSVPEYNQGIPIKAIVDLLEKRGKKQLIVPAVADE